MTKKTPKNLQKVTFFMCDRLTSLYVQGKYYRNRDKIIKTKGLYKLTSRQGRVIYKYYRR